MGRHFREIGFDQLSGWSDDDHLAAMGTFLKTARQMLESPYKTGELAVSSKQLIAIFKRALEIPDFDRQSAKLFFEENFTPGELDDQEQPAYSGFVTAYFEPEVAASRIKSSEFSAALYARPDDLADINDDNRPDDWDAEYRFAKGVLGKNGLRFETYLDRKAINNGYLDGRGLEIAYVKDAAEALFIHIQGSARLRLDDGQTIRVGYAAKSGHPYTAVGKVLLDRGALTRDNCGMRAIRNWFASNPEQMISIIEQNRSYIFFNEYAVLDINDGPIGASKVPLTAGRSLAVDRMLHTYGSPVWIETQEPLPDQNHPLQKLMIAQDTGSAIVGPKRGDLFLGSGDAAGKIAGDTRHRARFVVFIPKQSS